MRILVFGSGNYAKRLLDVIKPDIDVTAIVDNDSRKWDTFFYEYKIVSPLEIETLDFSYIFIASMYGDEIEKQLIELGIEKDRIISTFTDVRISIERTKVLNKVIDFDKATLLTIKEVDLLGENTDKVVEQLPRSMLNEFNVQLKDEDNMLIIIYQKENEIKYYIY